MKKATWKFARHGGRLRPMMLGGLSSLGSYPSVQKGLLVLLKGCHGHAGDKLVYFTGEMF